MHTLLYCPYSKWKESNVDRRKSPENLDRNRVDFSSHHKSYSIHTSSVLIGGRSRTTGRFKRSAIRNARGQSSIPCSLTALTATKASSWISLLPSSTTSFRSMRNRPYPQATGQLYQPATPTPSADPTIRLDGSRPMISCHSTHMRNPSRYPAHGTHRPGRKTLARRSRLETRWPRRNAHAPSLASPPLVHTQASSR